VKHYVQYHNPDGMGYEVRCDSDPFRIVTDKAVGVLAGNKVWLITGRGRPRQYFLCQSFIVDETGLAEDSSKKYFAKGKIGIRFPWLPIGEQPWFREFRESQANFRNGLSEIGPRFIPEFQKLAV
jgi:hypothetical protein